MDFLEKLKHQEKAFSKTELKVFNYAINHIETLETYTISKIANLSHTSTSAVLRFCQTLGYKGFKDFRYDAIHYLHHRHQTEMSDQLDSSSQTYSNLLLQFSKLNRDRIDQLVTSILSEKMIHIFGVYYSSLPAKYLHMALQDLAIPSQVAGDLNSGAHLTNIIKEEDVLIYFSLDGDISSFRSSLSAIQENMPTESYLITLNEKANTAKLFTHHFVLPGYLFSKQSILDRQAFNMVFVEMLINVIHEKRI
ncbi:MurR/RpiR family transcriptional regulator [Streptococcus castoreus]|uniref:MurR/RpiR family transcriptional regulator n=1 Tax=Streptococcus castoreus TaxID=254786 RepID=UPI0004204794|nr:MurR/RpiR family transcriptional regulator [Streptococcus castoreus]